MNVTSGGPMRVFIAVTLDDSLKTLLESLQAPLKAKCQRGSFTHKVNFHLTLAFIGLASDEMINALKELLDTLDFDPFDLSLGELGCFRRKEGEIWWIGIQKNPALSALHDQLILGLKERGLPFDPSFFVPHLTLVRNYRAKTDEPITLPDFDPAIISVQSVSLMKSERVQGELRYTEIHHHETQRTP